MISWYPLRFTEHGGSSGKLNWVMAYPKAEYENDMKSFDEYYSNVELCPESAKAHPKQAIQIRNHSMVDRSDLIAFYIEHESGGAFRTMQYAKSIGKKIINLADSDDPVALLQERWEESSNEHL